MLETVECVVVGAGVVGLAAARRLAMAGREVVILESEDHIGSHTSSRNSEIIHAGIYYPPHSLRARLCVAGKRGLYAYCEAHGIPHNNVKKVIVASQPSEIPRLKRLQLKAAENGVLDLEYLDGRGVEKLEPAVRAVAGLLSPSTGIIDSHSLMMSFLGDAQGEGAMLALRSPFLSGRVHEKGIEIEVGGDEPMRLLTRTLVNSAGLGAQSVALSIKGLASSHVPKRYLAKGNYYSMTGPQPFRHLVYPMPAASVLGVHVTIDLAGRCRFGPDLEWVDELIYDVDPSRAERFYDAVRTYFPALAADSLQPDYCGIRPKIHGPSEPQPDFVIQGPEVHGIGGLINLFGIESPGLTASLAIAETITQHLGQR